MYGVELYAAVRLAVVEEGLSHREAARRFGIDRRTVKKMLSYSAPPGYRCLILQIFGRQPADCFAT